MLLSIIVPVYNIERYIADCLDSLLDQGFGEGELEIICIDNGSTDDSADVIRNMMDRHPEITLLTTAVKGVSHARNIGIDNARGKYLYFCDGDDYLVGNCLSSIVHALIRTDSATASIGFASVQEDSHPLPFTKREYTPLTGIKRPFYSGNIWRFIIRKDIVIENGIRFHEQMSYAEDELFLYHICLHIDFPKHLYYEEPLYAYRTRSTSATHRKYEEKALAHTNSMFYLAKDIKRQIDLGIMSEERKRDSFMRYRIAIATYLWDRMLEQKKPTETLSFLRSEGMYPFGIEWRLLRPKMLKTMVINYIKLPFSWEWYYKLICGLFNRMKGTI